MKKIISIVMMMFAAVAVFGENDALLAKIKDANSANAKYSCPFKQEKHVKMMANPIKSEGTAYMSGNDKMSMIYTQPSGDLLVIADGKFVMVNRGKTRNHNVKEGSQMRTLRNTLLYSMRGDVNAIAEETNSTVKYTSGKTDTFEIARKEDVKMGYNKIILSFDKTTHLLTEMIMEEPSGTYTVYDLGKYDTSGNFADNVFALPKK